MRGGEKMRIPPVKVSEPKKPTKTPTSKPAPLVFVMTRAEAVKRYGKEF